MVNVIDDLEQINIAVTTVGMKQVLMGGNQGANTLYDATWYHQALHLVGTSTAYALAPSQYYPFFRYQLTGTYGAIKNLRVKLSAPPGGSYTFTIYYDTGLSPVTVTISGSNTEGISTGTLYVEPGKVVYMDVLASGTVATGIRAGWSFEFDSANVNESTLIGGGYNITTAPSYNGMIGGTWGNMLYWWNVAGAAGTIRDLYFRLQQEPGAGNTVKITLCKFNLSTYTADETPLSVTLTGTGENLPMMGFNDTATVSINPGDILLYKATVTGTIHDMLYTQFAATFSPTVNGESLVFGSTGSSGTISDPAYIKIVAGAGEDWQAEELRTQIPISIPLTLSKFYWYIYGSQPSGTSMTYNIRRTGANSELTLTIPSGGMQGSDLTHSAAFTASDYLNLQAVPSTINTLLRVGGWGCKMYIPPP